MPDLRNWNMNSKYTPQLIRAFVEHVAKIV